MSNENGDPSKCCFYSDPIHSWIEPMRGLGENPQFTTTCEMTYEGLSLMGQWTLPSMWDCLAYIFSVSP